VRNLVGVQIKEREMWRIWGEKRNAYRTLLVKHERKKLHGRSRPRRENNIKLDLKELRC
jgi:hypothetical protein